MLGIIIGLCTVISIMVYACVIVGKDYDDNDRY